MKICVILPCYNEAMSLPVLLPELQRSGIRMEDVIVINDGSTDSTTSAARLLGARVLDLPINLGIGGAMQCGFLWALKNGYSHAVQVDGDGQHPPSELQKLVLALDQSQANIVVGSRFLDGESEGFKSSRTRRVGIRFLSTLMSLLTKTTVRDITSGMRLVDHQCLELLSRSYPVDYPEPESLCFLAARGMKVCEVSVVMRERKTGSSSIFGWRQFYYMVKVSTGMCIAAFRGMRERHRSPRTTLEKA